MYDGFTAPLPPAALLDTELEEEEDAGGRRCGFRVSICGGDESLLSLFCVDDEPVLTLS